jgi:hypothetical protein
MENRVIIIDGEQGYEILTGLVSVPLLTEGCGDGMLILKHKEDFQYMYLSPGRVISKAIKLKCFWTFPILFLFKNIILFIFQNKTIRRLDSVSVFR